VPLLWVAQSGTRSASGKKDAQNINTGPEITISATGFIKTGPAPENQVKWVELEGKSIEAGNKDLERLKSEMDDIGLDLINTTKPETATGEIIDSNQNNAALESIVPIMVDHINNVTKAAFRMLDREVEPKSVVNTDFSPAGDGKDADNIVKLNERGTISDKAATKAPSVSRILGEDYDYEEDRKQLEQEAMEKARIAGATPVPDEGGGDLGNGDGN